MNFTNFGMTGGFGINSLGYGNQMGMSPLFNLFQGANGLGYPSGFNNGCSCSNMFNNSANLMRMMQQTMMMMNALMSSMMMQSSGAQAGFSPMLNNFPSSYPGGYSCSPQSYNSPGITGSSNGAPSNVQSVNPSNISTGSIGQRLAQDAQANATGSGGWCYKYVANAIGRQTGVQLSGGSAYMAADQLANNSKFREISVSKDQLKSLPAGAVVVWNKGNGHPHGHISIALGNGREASDKLRNQITNYGTSFRVFIPKG